MKRGKLCGSLLICAALVFFCGMTLEGAGFSPALNVQIGERGDTVEVSLPYDGTLGPVAAFRVQVEYDPEALEYLRPSFGETVAMGTTTTVADDGLIQSVFTASDRDSCLTQWEETIIYQFRVREEAVGGLQSISVSVFEIASPDAHFLGNDRSETLQFTIPDPPSSDARLYSLQPETGELDPTFSPDCLSYFVTVPYDVTTMTFQAEAAEGAIFRVNRKNLGSGGSDTVFQITVTAEDGETKLIYQVTVHREEKEEDPESADARLLSLIPAAGTLSPAFSPDILSYTLAVPYEVTTMTFTAEAAEGARFWVNRKNLDSGGSDTLFKITVTAEDDETKQIYEVTVHRNEKEEDPESADARLLSLIPATGSLSPTFSPDILSYTLTVPYEVTTMTFTAEAAEGARFWVNRKNLGSGGSDTLFQITVTAEDDETKQVYEVTVHRNEKEEDPESADARLLSLIPAAGTLSPAFSPDILSYTLTVPYEVTTMTFTAEAAEGARFSVNRKNLGSGGSDTLFKITVTAEDDETKQIYEVTVHRNEKEEDPESADARLLSLIPATGTLSPTFSPDILSYTLTVPYEVTTMTFTAEAAEGARFWVNRKNLGSGGSDTLFKITVTAEDDETKQIYEVTVHRNEKEEDPESADARLLSLIPATGTLSPTFSPDIISYTLTVPYEVTTMTFTAEAAEGARFWVNRKNLGSGGSDTLFKITVTAEDDETKQIYEVTVHRNEKEEGPADSTDARLLSLIPAAGTLSPTFSPDILSYTLTVPYEVTTMTFTAEAAEGARFSVNRKNLGSGGSDTLFKITVTAEDDETKQIYEVTVHRNEKEEGPADSTDARLLSLIPATGTLSPAFSPDILSYTLTVPYEVTTMTFTAEAAEGARFSVNRKNLGSGGSDTLFKITVTAEDDETKQVYEVTVHRNEKESANTASSSSHTSSSGSNESSGSHSSGGSGDTSEEKDTQGAGEKAAESEEKSQAVPVAVVSEPMDGTGGAGELLEGTDASEQISLNEENTSVLPGFLVLLGFSLFGFLSGPLSKWLAKRFPDEKSPDEPENPGP